MSFKSFKPLITGFALSLALFLMTATALPDRGRAANISLPVGSVVEDIPELPAANGSSDTPEIEVTMIDGKKVKLSSLRGKVCVIDMFASWCPHCQDHAPHMVQVYNQFAPKGFVMLSLATDQKEKIADVKEFIKKYKLNYPVGFLSNEVLAYYADTANHSIPQVVLFGKSGKMLKRWIGWSEERTKELTTLIQEEIGGAAPAVAEPAAPKTKTTAKTVAPAKTVAVPVPRRKK